jgi:hypothetical protein
MPMSARHCGEVTSGGLMKPSRLALIVAVAAIAGCTTKADPQPREFSIGCTDACEDQFRFPIPTDPVRNLLDNFAKSRHPPLKPGDRIQICNHKYCAIYTKNENAWRAHEKPVETRRDDDDIDDSR